VRVAQVKDDRPESIAYADLIRERIQTGLIDVNSDHLTSIGYESSDCRPADTTGSASDDDVLHSMAVQSDRFMSTRRLRISSAGKPVEKAGLVTAAADASVSSKMARYRPGVSAEM
jgi:hypothetical protein